MYLILRLEKKVDEPGSKVGMGLIRHTRKRLINQKDEELNSKEYVFYSCDYRGWIFYKS